MAGLVPAIHVYHFISRSGRRGLDLRIHLAEKMSCRVKPGNDIPGQSISFDHPSGVIAVSVSMLNAAANSARV